MIETLLARIEARDPLADRERDALVDAFDSPTLVGSGRVFIRQGQRLDRSTLLLSGLVGRFKDLSRGERQISALHIPGDFVDLHSFSLKALDHNVVALAPCMVAAIPHTRLENLTREHPHLTRLLWFLTNVDAAMHREWELSLGRRDAVARIAHLFCELRARLEIVGLVDEGGYTLPLSQAALAECTGLTPVHVNRTLKQLRERDLVEFRQKWVCIKDFQGLQQVAEFDPAYLYLRPECQ
ncbi:Crp/Fnr family transcriptional regulator [Allosphingosinicella indica]|uniref:cAMP-binding domain of CRP or a regulatory subunit of cAMP-dependent protein kinases n=1 Tax=Allosphingosinicella indica TaxID=941907 RepID=A0A1X7G046_9SPHN|nr:Crp/Fnr family transcriptional regulator [Allosphingosinicella indica]SMF61223.1 cAMP-binding domain of CRP or a regulatory subunit of cAMP-dependent protein kinases [Allosphingosinicella indica]